LGELWLCDFLCLPTQHSEKEETGDDDDGNGNQRHDGDCEVRLEGISGSFKPKKMSPTRVNHEARGTRLSIQV